MSEQSGSEELEVTCTSCGAPMRADDVSCPECGAVTPEGTSALSLTSAVTPQVLESSGPIQSVGSEPAYDLPVSSMALVVVRGSDEGRRIVLEGATIVGRGPDTGLFLDDVTVSRHHVELAPDAQGVWHLRDLGSLNGTYVNRRRADFVTLAGGDEVQVGKYRFVVQLGGGPA